MDVSNDAVGGGTIESGPAEFEKAQTGLLAQFGSRLTSRSVNLNRPQLRVHFLEGGRGPSVLMLHRGGGIAAGGVPLLSDLEREFRVIAPDSPGCGLTDKVSFGEPPFREYMVGFVQGFLDALGIQEVSIIGNSIGGYCALAFALAQPHRVRKLVLLGAPAGLTEAVPYLLRLLGMRGINRLLCATVLKPSLMGTRDLLRYVYVSNVARVPVEYITCAYQARLLPGAQSSWLAMLEHLIGPRGFRRRHLIAPELDRVRQPTLFIWGERDWFAPPSVGREICRVLPHAHIEVLDDAGHLPWLDQPEHCARLVSEFLT